VDSQSVLDTLADVLGDLEDLGILNVIEVKEPARQGDVPVVVVDLSEEGKLLVTLLALETAYLLLLEGNQDFLEDLRRGLPTRGAATLITMGLLRLFFYLRLRRGMADANLFDDKYVKVMATFFYNVLETEKALYSCIRLGAFVLARMHGRRKNV